MCLYIFKTSLSALTASIIGDAIEADDFEWVVNTLAIDSPVQIDIVPENLWHRDLDNSFHGGDALTVIPPTTLPASAKLNTWIEGPVRIRFLAKGVFQEAGPNALYMDISDISGASVSTTQVTTREDWSSFEVVCLKSGPLFLSWLFNVYFDSTDQVWLDQVEIYTIQKQDLLLTENPHLVPLGKAITLEIPFKAAEPLTYQWYKNGVPLEGAADPILLVEPLDEAGSVNYVASISANSYAFHSDPAVVQYLDLRDVLNNLDLQFQVPDQPDYSYSDLFLVHEAAIDGDVSLFLEVDPDNVESPSSTPPLLTTEVEGPVILTYLNTGPLKVDVNGAYPDGSFHVPTEDEHAVRSYIPIFKSGINQVSWSNNWAFVTGKGPRYTSGMLDLLKLTQNPVIVYGPFDQTVYVGLSADYYYEYIAVGNDVKFELLRNNEVITQSENPSSLYRDLNLGDDGLFQIRISNEFGGMTTSDPFHVHVTATVETALNQQHLFWEYVGIPWELQEFDTKEGGLATWVPDDREITGNGILSTVIPGPAKVSFWWKRPADRTLFFSTLDQSIRVAAPEDNQWHFQEVILPGTSNAVYWNGDHGSRLDNISIDYLDQNFFDKWTLSALGEDQASRPLMDKLYGNEDGDSFVNLFEWILNLDVSKKEDPQLWSFVTRNNQSFLELEFARPPVTHPYKIFLETSEDMISWSRDSIQSVEIYDRIIDRYLVTLRDTQPWGPKNRFVRLRVTDEE